eukprot:Gregarina_sp_Poly_1__9962@NODE_65_length_16489_cov_69_850445_g56_i0_p6_GENE_NODE_65_length_16489_cov_69_850445_g56_i0NODE_65_length_16489_cov_69_850445_g56_i0_p6_ORF_typecomplete_len140_score13_58_NODE_65_length_16489_cov_69_850445_g56_i01543015849
MWFSMCCSESYCKLLLPKDVHQCNSEPFLLAHGFFINPIPMDVASRICDHIDDMVPPDEPPCLPGQSTWECFGDDTDISDFGKFFILYTIYSTLTYGITSALFVIVKIATPLESFFFQVSNPNEFFLLHYLRKLFTPWG